MKQRTALDRPHGFSLIEVLIAVVVLSFGILALAALQSNLIKSSTEARAQSVALALAKDKLEQMRSFRSLNDYYALADSTAVQSINNTNAGTDDFSGSLGGVSGNLGGTNFTRSWTVTRYALPIVSGVPSTTYSIVASDTGALSSASYVPNSEYKVVSVNVGWTDAAGQTRSVKLEDAIAALDPVDSARNQRTVGGRARGPQVIIFDPSSDPGVIPIAVGDGSETAATNPKPVVQARTGDDTIETRFDVLTYSALSGNKALAQAKVETTVVGCTCTNATTTEIGYRPTYWNGLRYVPPERAPAAATARAKSGVTQSRYCDACCRDHHDPAEATGAKFSPRRTLHTHYRLQGTDLVVAGAGEDYLEACRLIRVDGIFDVAADLSDDYMNLLDTSSNGTNPAPSSSAVAGYQNFVLNYLDQRFRAPTSGTASQYNDRATPSPQTYAIAQDVQTPRPTANLNPSNGLRWLHSRGLYIDYLEPEAVDALNDAKTNCKGTGTSPPTATELRDCALRALPFTSINLTELADWTPISGPELAQIKVTNSDFDTSPGFTDPVRGKVTPGTSPTDGQVTNAVAHASASNSGIAISGYIDPDDVASELTAVQPMRINGTSSEPAGGGFRFETVGYAINVSNPRQLGFTHPAGSGNTPCNVSGTTNPVDCSTSVGETLPSALVLRVGNYNTSGSDAVSGLTCTYTKNNGTTETVASGQGQMPYRTVYDVIGFTSSNGAATFGTPVVKNPNAVGGIPIGEYTEVSISTVAGDPDGTAPYDGGDTITASMGSPTYVCPSNYPGSGQTLTCDKQGSTYTINNWANTFVDCPTQAAPPNF